MFVTVGDGYSESESTLDVLGLQRVSVAAPSLRRTAVESCVVATSSPD